MQSVRISLLSTTPGECIALDVKCSFFWVHDDYIELYTVDEPKAVRYFYGWTKLEVVLLNEELNTES